MADKGRRETELQFIQFISMLSNSAMQQLGKIMNPITGKTERNLEAAKATIDLISMLKEKTKGNLSDQESRAIADALSNLQLNYVDELKRDEEKKEKKKEEEEEEEKLK